MNCHLYYDLLDDYVDGMRAGDDGHDERFAAFEQHLLECERCQTLVSDLRSITGAASTLGEHVPSPRLWTQIASAIEEQQRQPWWQRQLGGGFSAWVPAAVAASVVMLLIAGAWSGWKETRLGAPQQGAAPSEDAEPIPAEQHYERAIVGLQQLADGQNAVLDPATRAVLTKNLALIDRAINESRAALAQEPGSTLAQESLLDALETKVALLQDTVALASDTGMLADDVAGGTKELN
jgi:hypothetical protein